MNEIDYSIILPVYNQADHIQSVVGEYVAALERFPAAWELILAVNGSRDDSWIRCRDVSAGEPRMRALQCPHAGWGSAVCTGIRESRGVHICYTNSARTSASDLLLMLLYAHTNPDVVIKANRKIRESRSRRLGSLLYNMECRALFDLPYWDINGTPKIFPRKFHHLVHLSSQDDLIDLEFHVICRRHNYPVLEVPILSVKRHGGRSTTRWRSALRMYLGAYRMWRKFPGHVASSTNP